MFELSISAAIFLFFLGGVFGSILAYKKIKESLSKKH